MSAGRRWVDGRGAHRLRVRTTRARAALEPHVVPDRSLIGGAQELIDQLAQYADLGVEEFAIADFTLGDTPEQRRYTYEALHADVLSAFR